MKTKITTEQYLQKAKKIHGSKYDYSLTEYNHSHEKIKIICNIHNIFEQTANSHLNGRGCPTCGHLSSNEKNKITIEEFIEKAKKIHGSKYDYSLTKCNGAKNKINIICKMHNSFNQRLDSHLQGNGCPKCFINSYSLTKKEFIEKAKKIHGNKYDYSQISYINNKQKIKIICKQHNSDFLQKPSHHLTGHNGCLKCYHFNISRIELKWLKFLKIEEKFWHKTIKINNKVYNIDAYIPESNTIYEFFGDYWHGNPDSFNLSDVNKTNKKTFKELYEKTINRINFFKENGYNLVYIWEKEFKKIDLDQ